MTLYNANNQSWNVRVDLPTTIRTIRLAGWVCVLLLMPRFRFVAQTAVTAVVC